MESRLLPVLAVLALAPRGSAQVVHDNFTADGSFFRIGWSVIGASSSQPLDISQGESFVSQATGSVGRLTIAMGHSGGANAVRFLLYEDAVGILGRQIGLPVFAHTAPGSVGLPDAKIKVDLSEVGWNVRQGSRYWLVTEGEADSSHAWQMNLVGDSGRHYVLDSRSGAPEYSEATHGAFRLDLVPEPGTLLALALPGWLIVRRHR